MLQIDVREEKEIKKWQCALGLRVIHEWLEARY